MIANELATSVCIQALMEFGTENVHSSIVKFIITIKTYASTFVREKYP